MKTIEEYLNLIPGTIEFPMFGHGWEFTLYEEWGEDEPFSHAEMVWSEEKREYKLIIEKDKEGSWLVAYVAFGMEGAEYSLPLTTDQIEEMQREEARIYSGGIYRSDLREALAALWTWLQENGLL